MWTESLTGQSGNYAAITQTLTPADGQCLEAIYQAYSAHAIGQEKTISDYLANGTAISFEDEIADLENPINIASIATLKAVGCVSVEGVHVGLTALGYDFLITMGAI